MEIFILVVVVFVLGYTIGLVRSDRRHRAARDRASDGRPSSRYRGSSRRYPEREREYGGFGALGAQHDPGDSGF